MDKTGFFEEKPGIRSMNRLISFEMVQAGVFIALVTVLGVISNKIDAAGAVTLISMALSFITGGITSKELGKRAERNMQNGN